jgi:hypothetical protein
VLSYLVQIVVAGDTFLYICFFFSLGRLYSNSLLATLNARNMIREAANVGQGGTVEDLSLGEMKDLEMSKGSRRGVGTVSFLLMWVGRRLLTRSCSLWFQRPTQISIKITNTEEYTRDHSSGSAGSGDTDTDVRRFSSSILSSFFFFPNRENTPSDAPLFPAGDRNP